MFLGNNLLLSATRRISLCFNRITIEWQITQLTTKTLHKPKEYLNKDQCNYLQDLEKEDLPQWACSLRHRLEHGWYCCVVYDYRHRQCAMWYTIDNHCSDMSRTESIFQRPNKCWLGFTCNRYLHLEVRTRRKGAPLHVSMTICLHTACVHLAGSH